MIIQCPSCFSDNVTNLSYDSNDFICNDCGEDFKADNGIEIDETDDNTPTESGFIDLDPKTALELVKKTRENNSND